MRLAQKATVHRQIPMEAQLERGEGVEKVSTRGSNVQLRGVGRVTLAPSTCKRSLTCQTPHVLMAAGTDIS